MLIKLEFEDNVILDEIDILTRGNITLEGKKGIISSSEMSKNQSSMIFLSLVELLDGIRLFINDKSRYEYNYVAVDSSFQFYLVKKLENMLVIENSKRNCIEEINEDEFIKVVGESITSFFQKNYSVFNRVVITDNDLNNSLNAFSKEFGLKLF